MVDSSAQPVYKFLAQSPTRIRERTAREVDSFQPGSCASGCALEVATKFRQDVEALS